VQDNCSNTRDIVQDKHMRHANTSFRPAGRLLQVDLSPGARPGSAAERGGVSRMLEPDLDDLFF
jgi:hypothetical protein